MLLDFNKTKLKETAGPKTCQIYDKLLLKSQIKTEIIKLYNFTDTFPCIIGDDFVSDPYNSRFRQYYGYIDVIFEDISQFIIDRKVRIKGNGIFQSLEICGRRQSTKPQIILEFLIDLNENGFNP